MADKTDTIARKDDQNTKVLETIDSEFTEKKLGVVARYLERSGETFPGQPRSPHSRVCRGKYGPPDRGGHP